MIITVNSVSSLYFTLRPCRPTAIDVLLNGTKGVCFAALLLQCERSLANSRVSEGLSRSTSGNTAGMREWLLIISTMTQSKIQSTPTDPNRERTAALAAA